MNPSHTDFNENFVVILIKSCIHELP